MNQSLIILFLVLSLNSFSQESSIRTKSILFDYTFQIPFGDLDERFGNNSSMGLTYLINKDDLLYGIDGNFMFGNNIKNDSLLESISTSDGYLINASGELDNVLLYQRGFNSHLLIGRSFRFNDNNETGIYTYAGLGFIQHKIRIESDRTNLPQINEEYIQGYDMLTQGLSSKLCVKYMYFDKKTSIKFYIGTEIIYALTKNHRDYNFSLMTPYDTNLRKDNLLGMKLGVIIPINRNNEGKFYYK